MTLQNLLGRSLDGITPDKTQIAKLLAAAQRNIQDAQLSALSAENRFDAAYKAIMQLSMAALQAHGYRTLTSKPGHHPDCRIGTRHRQDVRQRQNKSPARLGLAAHYHAGNNGNHRQSTWRKSQQKAESEEQHRASDSPQRSKSLCGLLILTNTGFNTGGRFWLGCPSHTELYGLRWIANTSLRAPLPMQCQRARNCGGETQTSAVTCVDFRVTKKLVVFSLSGREIQVDFISLPIDQLQRMTVYIIAIGNMPLHYIIIALLLCFL